MCRSLYRITRVSLVARSLRPRRDNRGVDLISDALPFGRLWYAEANAISNAIGYAKFFSGSDDAVIRVYDSAGTVAATQGGGSAPLVLKRAGAVPKEKQAGGSESP